MSFRKLCHMTFRKLIPPFTLTGFGQDAFFKKKKLYVRVGSLFSGQMTIIISVCAVCGYLLFKSANFKGLQVAHIF